jgi:hypothetical protein
MADGQFELSERSERAMVATYVIRSDVIWPSDLSPPRPPALVYLDMLGWINMAEVEAGHTAPGRV